MKPTTNTCRIQDIIDSLREGDRVRQTFKTGTTVECEVAMVGLAPTYTVRGVARNDFLVRYLSNIEILKRARPKLAVGDKIRIGTSPDVYVVMFVNDRLTKAIHSTSLWTEPFTLKDSQTIVKI